MNLSGTLVGLLLGRASAASRDAARILDELRGTGQLTDAEVADLEAAITEAVAASRQKFEEMLIRPIGETARSLATQIGVATGNGEVEDLRRRVGELEERLARLERAGGERQDGAS